MRHKRPTRSPAQQHSRTNVAELCKQAKEQRLSDPSDASADASAAAGAPQGCATPEHRCRAEGMARQPS